MKLLTVVGARPQFIKAAVLSRALRECARESIQEVLVHTGQHYDAALSQVFFDQLGLPSPAVNLGVGSASHAAQTAEMLEGLERVILYTGADRVLVYGDTNSTLAGALAAAKLNTPVAHVEAGLRSFDLSMPEEINRLLTTHLADLLFCPTEKSVHNLRVQGIEHGVHQVGDVMYDCALTFGAIAEKTSTILEELRLERHAYFVATVHRASNTDDPQRLGRVVEAIQLVASQIAPVVWPVHPRTRKMAPGMDSMGQDGLRLTRPLPYLDMQRLIANARGVLTDSGGVQKEAFFHRVPCLTLRDRTEWVETVEGGYNRLVDVDPVRIVEQAATARWPEGPTPSLYGEGRACERIVDVLLTH